MGKSSFIVFHDWREKYLAILNDAEVGQLLRAMMDYSADGKEPPFQQGSALWAIFAAIRVTMDENIASYQRRCEANRNNGPKGGRPPKNGASEKTQHNPVGFKKPNITQWGPNNPDTDTDTDTDRDTEKRENDAAAAATPTKFTPPTLEEVSAYCQERQNIVDAGQFIDFYTSKGWKVGNQSMKDWKAAVRTWERRDRSPGGNAAQGRASPGKESKLSARDYLSGLINGNEDQNNEEVIDI